MSTDLEARLATLEARQSALDALLRGMAKPPLPAPLLLSLVAAQADVSRDADRTLLPWREILYSNAQGETRLILRAVSGFNKPDSDSYYNRFTIYRSGEETRAGKGFTLIVDRGQANIQLAPETSLDDVEQLGLLIARMSGYRVLTEEEAASLRVEPAVL